MAVCRRTRVVKLTILLVFIVGILFILFPDEFKQFLTQFAPPSSQKNIEKIKEAKDAGDARDQPRNPVVMNQKRKHSEQETYLTPGNPGNFEPLRDEEGAGPGEKGVAHKTKPGQADEVDQSITDYGEYLLSLYLGKQEL